MNYEEAYVLVKPYTMLFDELRDMWDIVQIVDDDDISGDIIEMGCYNGGCCALMALAHKDKTRKIHLYDSFEGLPETTEIDGEKAKNYIGQCVASVKDAEEVMTLTDYPESLVKIHKGWFKDTIPNSISSIGKLAVLRLDCDWHESIKICLENFYPLLSVGGFLVIDDYNSWPGATIATDEYLKDKVNQFERSKYFNKRFTIRRIV